MLNLRLSPLLLLVLVLGLLQPVRGFASSTDQQNSNLLSAEITALELQQQMQKGAISAEAITRFYLQRIELLNQRGPSLHAIISVNPDAITAAKALDVERNKGLVRGPLHGIPVILKDNIDTKDKMPTTAGALVLANNFAKDDAFIVQRLRAQGAVILAKANLSEWANFRSDYASSGWSTMGGQTRNPYVLDRNPCGSSSGSAVAVAANLAPLAVGTETDGSIVCPSSVNGVVGIKPTVGLLSRSGIIPISHSQDTAGPMAKTVADAAMLLGQMTGVDHQDQASLSSKGIAGQDYQQYLDPQALKGAVIGVVNNLRGFSPKTEQLFEKAIAQLNKAGAKVIVVGDMPYLGEYYDAEYEVLLYEFKSGINAYLNSSASQLPVQNLAQIIRFNQQHKTEVMPHFGQEVLELAEQKGGLDASEYQKALKQSRSLARKGIDELMQAHQLDALIAPVSSPAWLTDHINGDHYTGGSSSPAAVAGYPSITVPMGQVRGLPVGLAFIASQWQEPKLIALAYAYEQISKARITPEFKDSLE